MSAKLQIVRAFYGKDKQTDVCKQVQFICSQNGGSFVIDAKTDFNNLFGDAERGKDKLLHVVYKYGDGNEQTGTWAEKHQKINIPAVLIVSGTLTINIKKGLNLRDNRTFGKQCPYVKLNCGQEKFQTKVHDQGGVNPEWNQSFLFNIDGKDSHMHMVVMDKEILTDGIIGRLDIPLATLCAATGEVAYPLVHPNDFNKGAGTLLVDCKYVDPNVKTPTATATTAQVVFVAPQPQVAYTMQPQFVQQPQVVMVQSPHAIQQVYTQPPPAYVPPQQPAQQKVAYAPLSPSKQTATVSPSATAPVYAPLSASSNTTSSPVATTVACAPAPVIIAARAPAPVIVTAPAPVVVAAAPAPAPVVVAAAPAATVIAAMPPPDPSYSNASNSSYTNASSASVAASVASSVVEDVSGLAVYCKSYDGKVCGFDLPSAIGTQDFTICAMVKRSGGGYAIIAAQDRAGFSAPQCRLELNKDNKVEFVIADKSSGVQTWPGFVSSETLDSEKWTHVAVTREGTKHRMYMNHEQVAVFDSSSTIDITYDSNDSNAPKQFRVGSRHPSDGSDDAASPFPGEISNLKLVYACLTPQDKQMAYSTC
jgi:hypothetical protein